MEKETASTKSDPIVIEQAGMRMTVAHRSGLGGTDEGLTFDITTADSEGAGNYQPPGHVDSKAGNEYFR